MYKIICNQEGDINYGIDQKQQPVHLAEQWQISGRSFYCDAIDKDVLVVKGEESRRTFFQQKGSDNIISSGSGIAVADGQCMIIVEQGKVVEVCAEPGQFTYDASTEPSIFAGSLGEGSTGL